MEIKPMTEEERKASLDRALKNAKEHPFDEYQYYGENNPPLKTKGNEQ